MFIEIIRRTGNMKTKELINVKHITTIRSNGQDTVICLVNGNIIYAAMTYEQIIKMLNEIL